MDIYVHTRKKPHHEVWKKNLLDEKTAQGRDGRVNNRADC